MGKSFLLRCFLCLLLIVGLCTTHGFAQRPRNTRPGTTTTEDAIPQQTDRQGRVIPNRPGQSSGQDSLKHRDNSEDSITIYFRYFDSTRTRFLDSSVSDFGLRYPVPAHYVTLGNFGAPARSLLFSPHLKPGFDAGFHAFDIYRFKITDTRFFQTTRPFTELGYMIGGKGEQVINVLHTQNIKPNFNMALQYRLINSPGEYQNQNSNHSSYRLNGNYQSRNKRYTVFGIYLVNNLGASENGGIQRDTLLSDFRYTNRYVIPTRLSGDSTAQRNPFNSKITTGNVYSEKTFLLRQHYDLGQRDSLIVNDSTVIRLFYPRFRLQHTFTFSAQQYEFRDNFVGINKTNYYRGYFGYNDSVLSNILYRDKWKDMQNDFSIISFPEKNNLNQFIKAGLTYQKLNGTFKSVDSSNQQHHNIFLNGEYRNRTRNQQWDIEAVGSFYLNGLNSGDYNMQLELKRVISKKLGYLQVGFQNVNRTPSYIFGNSTAYPLSRPNSMNKENSTRIYGAFTNDKKGFTLSGDYFLVSNYTFFDNFFHAAQYATLFNVLHVAARQKFNLTKVLRLYSEVHLQKAAGNPPVNMPLIFTSNRVSLEGVYARNLLYAFGVEIKYHTRYKADNYSPFSGQFFYQDSYTVKNRPEVNLFFNFRIKRFYAYIRAENLNTFSRNTGSLGFNENNFSAQHYPQQSLWIRFGVWWTFIN